MKRHPYTAPSITVLALDDNRILAAVSGGPNPSIDPPDVGGEDSGNDGEVTRRDLRLQHYSVWED